MDLQRGRVSAWALKADDSGQTLCRKLMFSAGLRTLTHLLEWRPQIPKSLLIVSSGGRLGFERFPQPQPPAAVENFADVRSALLLLPRIVCGYVGEERATRCYDSSLQYGETSRPECRAAGCTLFPNEYSDVVCLNQPDSTIRFSPEQGPAHGS